MIPGAQTDQYFFVLMKFFCASRRSMKNECSSCFSIISVLAAVLYPTPYTESATAALPP